MQPSIQKLGQILYAPAQYVIPVFQRNYRWELQQWEKFWESLVEIQSPEKRGNHFMGFLVFVPGFPQPGQHIRFHLIDGQQRLSTSSILLIAIRNVARRHGETDLADEIHGYYLVHPLKKSDQHFRLLPKERDHDAYIALVQGGDAVQGRMADALTYFEKECEDLANDEPAKLRSLFHAMCQRLEFMCATLEAENAYNIFKSLNSTGVPLGPADLIRNFVFMHVAPDDQDEFDRTCWSQLEDRFARDDGSFDEERFSRFFRDFLMSSGKYVSPKDTFEAFETRFEATEFSPQNLASNLLQAATHYAIISGERPDHGESVTQALVGLNQLDSSTTYPLLLSLFARRAAGTIDAEQLALGIEMLKGFILRRFICGESSRGYGRMFVRALAQEGGDTVAALEKYLLERGWPDDRRFTEAFRTFPLYVRQYAREILQSLERARGHKEPADLQNAQIEHVMPQTLNDAWRTSLGTGAERIHADWLHRPGNLTLSGYNLELWNHPFEVKQRRYADSNIVLTRELANSTQWCEEEIRERGRRLGMAAAAIWIGPKDPLPQPVASEPPVKRTRFELRATFWSQLQRHLTERSIRVPEFDATWRSAHVSLPSHVKHIGVRLRYSIRQSSVAIVLWFFGHEARALWEELRSSPEAISEMARSRWQFSEIPGRTKARVRMEQGGIRLREEREWPKAFEWFETRLPLLYEHVLPSLGQALGDATEKEAPEPLSPRAVLHKSCPDESKRMFLLKHLLQSIKTADAIAPRSWAVTLFADGFRLNVGAVEALTFGDGELRVLLHGQFSKDRVRGEELSDCPYKNAPAPSAVFQGSLSRYAEIADDVQAAHFAYLRGAATTPSGRPRRSSFARHHSKELVDYARQTVGA